jgi:hypothetical protein
MARHAKPVPETDTDNETQQQQPGMPPAEIARMDKLDMHFLLNYIALRHPEAYADARSAQAELAARNAAHRAEQEQAITTMLDQGSGDPDSVWASYADALQVSEDRVTMHAAMTGDDLITLITHAPTEADALDVARRAPASARSEAADTLHVDTFQHSTPWINRAIVREARA